jgi:hypothetical protein
MDDAQPKCVDPFPAQKSQVAGEQSAPRYLTIPSVCETAPHLHPRADS